MSDNRTNHVRPERARTTLTLELDGPTYGKLLRMRERLAERIADPTLDDAVEVAILMYIAHVKAQHMPRNISPAIRRAVYQRDAGRCAIVVDGERCDEITSLALRIADMPSTGGELSVDDLHLMCLEHREDAAERALDAFITLRRDE